MHMHNEKKVKQSQSFFSIKTNLPINMFSSKSRNVFVKSDLAFYDQRSCLWYWFSHKNIKWIVYSKYELINNIIDKEESRIYK